MLKLENVKKRYGDFQLECSLEVRSGFVTGLIGANGAGKSTTFKSILDLISIDSGKITIFDKDFNSITTADKEDIGVVLGTSGFSGYLSIKQIIPILDEMYHRFDKAAFIKACGEYRLPMDKKIKDFSTGMQARLKLMVAMCHDARLLILDEPTSGLDVIARDSLLDQLRSYLNEKEGRSILISSHISSDLEGFCDDIYMLHRGNIMFHEETDVLMDEYGILKVDNDQYEELDKSYILYAKDETYGKLCLCRERQYYRDNYPGIVIERSGLDGLLTVVEKGARI